MEYKRTSLIALLAMSVAACGSPPPVTPPAKRELIAVVAPAALTNPVKPTAPPTADEWVGLSKQAIHQGGLIKDPRVTRLFVQINRLHGDLQTCNTRLEDIAVFQASSVAKIEAANKEKK